MGILKYLWTLRSGFPTSVDPTLTVRRENNKEFLIVFFEILTLLFFLGA